MKRPRHSLHVAVAAALACALVLACRVEQPPEARWPAGALLVARTEALETLLARFASMEGTPLAGHARVMREALPDCPEVEARAPLPSTALLDAIVCRGESSEMDRVYEARAGADVLFALPADPDDRVVARATLREGDLELELQWPNPAGEGPLALLVPGDEPVGPALFSDRDRLVHLRVRPEHGIDLASLIPAGSQADRLFRLRSALFTEAVLDGTWEAAIYLPAEDGQTPRVALALGFQFQGAAVAAAEQFVGELARTWRVARTDFAVESARGACLPGMNVLPELAPCYVATPDALVVGWNASSLRHALGEHPAQAMPLASGRAELDLALFSEADAILSRHLAPEERPRPTPWPWDRAVASAHREKGVLDLRVELLETPGT